MQKLFSTGKITLTPDAPLVFKNDNGNLLAVTFFTATCNSGTVVSPVIIGKRNGEDWDSIKGQRLPGIVLAPRSISDSAIGFASVSPGDTTGSPFIVLPPGCSVTVKKETTGFPTTVYYVGLEAFDEIQISVPSGTNNSVTLSVDLCIS